MKIELHGAAGGEVTGSMYLVRTKRATVLVDAGLFQGGKKSEELNRTPLGIEPHEIAAVLLTHAHLDHTGRVPLLIKHGYTGPIYATPATIELSEIILKDSARIQVADVQRMNRRRARAGEPLIEPLYEPQHVEPYRSLAKAVPYHTPVPIAEGITARWVEAGHLLGAASIELTVEEDGRRKVVVFSGDLGPLDRPILRDFETFSGADLVFLESTYGDRDHRPYADTITEFERIVQGCAAARGKILVPTFAIGRAELIIYHFAVLFHEGGVQPFPVFLDSPMAVEASEVFRRHPELGDQDFERLVREGVFPVTDKFFHRSVTVEESQRLNTQAGPCAILAGAGMCNAGRILHHFAHNLPKPGTHVLIVGYQGNGSLGRRLIDGAKEVSIHGERIHVNAQIHTLGGFSGHAGQTDLLKWFAPLAPSKPRVAMTHGEDGPRGVLAGMIAQRFAISPQLPALGEAIEL